MGQYALSIAQKPSTCHGSFGATQNRVPPNFLGDGLGISKNALLSFAYSSKMWEIALQTSLYIAAK